MVCVGSEIHRNKAQLIGSDQCLSYHLPIYPHQAVLSCYLLGHQVVQGLRGHPVRESLMKAASPTLP